MPARSLRPHAAALLATIIASPAALAAQAAAPSATPPGAPGARLAEVSAGDAATTLHACYVPNSGTTYRIKTADTKPACASPNHVEFSWTTGGGASGGAPDGAAAGDLAGSYPAPTVAGLQGRALSGAAPASGDVLAWNGSAWAPAAAAAGAPLPNAGGDASGALTALTVTGLQGRAVLGTAPASGNVLAWNGAAWAPAAAPAAGGSAFALPYAGTATSAVNTSLFKVTQQGAGVAGEFLGTGGGTAVRGSGLGSVGVHGLSSLGGANAVGVRAEHASETGTALEVAKGAIKVTGAGLNTNTAVFWTRTTDMSPQCTNDGTWCDYTIDHPMTNGAPNALLTVTPRSYVANIRFAPQSFLVFYDAAISRWRIRAEYYSAQFAVSEASRFNILVVKP